MSLRRESTQRHTSGVKALDDICHRLDRLNIYGRAAITQLQQVTKRRDRTVVHQTSVFNIGLVITILNRTVQSLNHVWVVGMIFLTVDIFQQAAGLDRLAQFPGKLFKGCLINFNIVESGAFETADKTGEAEINYFSAETNGFK